MSEQERVADLRELVSRWRVKHEADDFDGLVESFDGNRPSSMEWSSNHHLASPPIGDQHIMQRKVS